jgi:hypothetical protein
VRIWEIFAALSVPAKEEVVVLLLDNCDADSPVEEPEFFLVVEVVIPEVPELLRLLTDLMLITPLQLYFTLNIKYLQLDIRLCYLIS